MRIEIDNLSLPQVHALLQTQLFKMYELSPSSTDFSKLQAFSSYTAEIYVNGSTTPIVETARTLAAVEVPSNFVKRPLHDLSPSLAVIKPPLPSISSVLVSWIRNPLAINFTGAFFYFESPFGSAGFSSNADLSDGFSINPSSTSITVPVAQGSAPAFTTAPGSGAREVGLSGTASRAAFQQSIYWSN